MPDMPTIEDNEEQEAELVKQNALRSLRGKSDADVEEAVINETISDADEKKLRIIEKEMIEKLMPFDVIKKLMPFAVTKTEMTDLEARIDQKLNDLKDLLLRARAQGKARIVVKEQDKESRLKEIYKGTGIFGED